MRWEAWPALLAVVGWACLLVASAAAYRPGGPAELVPPLVLAGVPLIVAAWAFMRDVRRSSAAEATPGPPGGGSSRFLRFAVAGTCALVLGAFGLELASAPTAFDVGLDAPILARPLLPGPSEAWAYLAAVVLTVGAVARTPRGGIVVAAIFAAGTLAGGAALSASASAVIGSGPGPAPGCAERIRVIVPPSSVSIIVSTGTGELDGASIGWASVRRYPGTPASVSYDTRWGSGSHELFESEDHRAFQELRETLSPDRLISADDLGIDAILGSAVRHCRVVIDGRAAVQGFFALRWLTGADATTAEPGAGLEAWRGLLDYWIIRAVTRGSTPGDAGNKVVVAAVRVDGQPRDWPLPGLHATLHATTWFGGL